MAIQGKVQGVERLRAVAIVMVYLIHVHVFGYFKALHALGTWAGVDLFFVISGFVVTLSLERLLPERAPTRLREPLPASSGATLRSFYIRRFFRLAPIAACAVLLHLAGAYFGTRIVPESPFLTVRDWAYETLAIVTGLYNYLSPWMGQLGMGYFWSLSVEEQFYLVLPAVFLAAPTRAARTIAALAVLLGISLVVRPLFSPNHFTIAHYTSHYRFDALAAGVVLGLQRDKLGIAAARVGPWGRRVVVALALLVILYVAQHTKITFAIHNGLTVIWLASACLVACAAIDSRDVLDIPGLNRVLEHIGSRSYAIYVLHVFFIYLDETVVLGAGPRLRGALTGMPGESVRFVVTAALVVAAAEIAHRYVEQPAIAFGKRFVQRANQR